MKREDIRIRDPFILVENGVYYMYGTTDIERSYTALPRYSVYRSYDLNEFEGPFLIFDGIEYGYWADYDYWAAEVHKYNGKFYLFGSFKSKDHCRASAILVSDSPMGPFIPTSKKPITPEDWECLDGTLFVENSIPYIVFCHEWVQVENGQICAAQLNSDFTEIVGEPKVLFCAGDNPYVTGFSGKAGNNCKITDGPFLYRENGKIKMIWSSMSEGRYVVLEAEADSLFGKWEHKPSRFSFDGGHAMIFTDKNGKRMISLHHPNTPPMERATFFEY